MSKEQETTNYEKHFQSLYKKLKEPFPKEALSVDSSRGFDLTSVKAQYAVERLNEVCGIDGWRHSAQNGTTGYELVDDGKGVIFKGQLVISKDDKGMVREAVGYAKIKKNIGDAYKGAKTDSLSKCASQFGLANDVFKGLVSPPGAKPRSLKNAPKSKTSEDF